MPIVTDRVALHPVVLLVGLFGSAYRPAQSTCVAENCRPEQYARAFALNRLAINLGLGIAPMVAGFLALRSYGLLFLVDGITCLVAALPLLFLGLAPKRDVAAEPEGGRSPWQDGRFLVIAAFSVLLLSVHFQVLSTLPMYWRDVCGLREDSIGVLLAINPMMVVTLEMLIVHKLRNRYFLSVASWGCSILAMGFAVLLLGGSVQLAVLSVVVCTLGEMLESPFIASYVARRATARHVGRYMGVHALAFAFALIVAPVIGIALVRLQSDDALDGLHPGVFRVGWRVLVAVETR